MNKTTPKWVLRAGMIAATSVICAFAVMIYVLGYGVPFVEGDTIVTEGEAYGFEIGMSRDESFAVIQNMYNKPEYFIRLLWQKDDPAYETIDYYQNTRWAQNKMRKYNEFKELVLDVSSVNPPMEMVGRWDVDMPAKWVNTIYLMFKDERLNKIQKSRWLFERP